MAAINTPPLPPLLTTGVVLLLRELGRQAAEEGGAVYMLNGNHEALNVCGDFRYVTAGAFVESAAAAGLRGDALQVWDNQLRARLRLYSPGGPMAVELSKNPAVLVVNDTVFAHGGLLPQHVKYGLERLNAEVAAWMRGARNADGTHAAPPFLAMGYVVGVVCTLMMYMCKHCMSKLQKYSTHPPSTQ